MKLNFCTAIILIGLSLTACDNTSDAVKRRLKEIDEQPATASQAKDTLTDTIPPEDARMLEKLNAYFSKHNTELCAIYKALYVIEGDCIKEADKKYPDFGQKHNDYFSKLYAKEQAKLFKQYQINDTLSTYISAFGVRYCK